LSIRVAFKHNLGSGLTLATLGLLLPLQAAVADWVGDARPMMGTEVSVYLWAGDPEAGDAIVEKVFAEAARIDHLMSTYREDSEISEINRDAAARPVRAGNELFDLIRRALDISVLTGGAFDITFDSVGQYFDFRARRRPDEETIAEEKQNID